MFRTSEKLTKLNHIFIDFGSILKKKNTVTREYEYNLLSDGNFN